MRTRCIRTLMFAFGVLCLSAAAFAAVGVVITVAPPPLPVYEQPVCPADGYLWTPGYWAWGDDFDDYYWVPGTWVMAPEVGFLWTPGYWGWGDSSFVWYDGYWGPEVGFYGGVNYGFGYFGVGFEGGRWDNGHFFYNRAVLNVNGADIHNVYETRINNVTVNRISYNGGNGGITARPTPQQEAARHQRHIDAVAAQTEQRQHAQSDPEQRASRNEGRPAIAATGKPGDFSGKGVTKASAAGGPYAREANRRENAPRENGTATRPEENTRTNTSGHVRDLAPLEKPAAPNTGNAKDDKKIQKEQDKQYAQQQKERQKLQQQQEKEDQKMAKQNANDTEKQQTEQRHQQQTQHLQAREQQQSHEMQQRAQHAPTPRAERRPPE